MPPAVSKGLLADIKRYDPLLVVQWNCDRERWQVGRLVNTATHFNWDQGEWERLLPEKRWRKDRILNASKSFRWHGGSLTVVEKEPFFFFTVQGLDGSFRPLDRRILLYLWRSDMQRQGGARRWFRERIIADNLKVARSRVRDQDREQEDILRQDVLPAAKKDFGEYSHGASIRKERMAFRQSQENMKEANAAKGRIRSLYVDLDRSMTEQDEDNMLEDCK